MRASTLLLGALLAAFAFSAQAADTNPAWKRKPTGEEVGEVYPLLAEAFRMPGRVMLYCTVTPQGELTPCTVVGEQPAGMGFGRAGLALAAKFEFHPATSDGVPKSAALRIPIIFNPPKLEKPPVDETASTATRKAAADLIAVISPGELVRWSLGKPFEMASKDPAVDEPLRSAVVQLLTAASRAREPELRAAFVEAYAANLSQSELEAMVRWTRGDPKPLSELEESKLARLELAIEAATDGFRRDARMQLCEMLDCIDGPPAAGSRPPSR